MKTIQGIIYPNRICYLLFWAFSFQAKAQFAVFDPGNLAGNILNTAREIIQTTSSAKNTLKGFQETAKIYEQGKKYYDGAPI